MDVYETLKNAERLLTATILDNVIEFARNADNQRQVERDLITNGNALYFIKQACDSLAGWEN